MSQAIHMLKWLRSKRDHPPRNGVPCQCHNRIWPSVWWKLNSFARLKALINRKESYLEVQTHQEMRCRTNRLLRGKRAIARKEIIRARLKRKLFHQWTSSSMFLKNHSLPSVLQTPQLTWWKKNSDATQNFAWQSNRVRWPCALSNRTLPASLLPQLLDLTTNLVTLFSISVKLRPAYIRSLTR